MSPIFRLFLIALVIGFFLVGTLYIVRDAAKGSRQTILQQVDQ